MIIQIKEMPMGAFQWLNWDDINYSKILFVFDIDDYDIIYDKLINHCGFNKEFRMEKVKETSMFFVENMDIQTVDSQLELCNFIHDKTIEYIYFIMRERDE